MTFRLTRVSNQVLPILVLLVLAAIYAKVRHFDYVWDDRALFVNSPALRVIGGFSEFWAAISTPILPGTTYFRPLVQATFVAEFNWFGVSPALSHGINIALFLTNVMLVGWLARRIIPSRAPLIPQMVAMLLYGFHPANSEAACWVAGRFDLMVTTFGLCMLLAALTLQGWRRLAATGLSFFLACLCKEMAVVLPVAAFVLIEVQRPAAASWRLRLQDWLTGGQRNLALTIFAAGALYLLLRLATMPALAHVDEGLAVTFTAWNHVVYVGRALWFYVQACVFPFLDLAPQHPLVVADLKPVDTVKAFAALALAGGLVVGALVKRTPVLTLLALAVVSLAPVLHIIPLSIGGNIGHERFMTLPLAFAALAVGWAVTRAWTTKWMRLNALAVAGWTVIATLNLMVTVPLWSSDTSLWQWAYSKHPKTKYIQSSLLSSLIASGDLAEARKTMTAIKLHRGEIDDPSMLLLEAHLDVREGKPAAGLEKLTRALPAYESQIVESAPFYYGGKPDPVSVAIKNAYWQLRFAYSTLSEAHLRLRQFDKAVVAARVALLHDPRYPPAHFALALALYGADKWDEGQAALREAHRLYIARGMRESMKIRREFLSQVCMGTDAPRQTCDAWRLEQEQASRQP